MNRARLRGKFICEMWSPRGKTHRLLERWESWNGICDAGIRDMFDQYFGGGSGRSWFLAPISAADFVGVDNENDTMSSHVGWSEVDSYDEATRPAWGPDATAGTIISNSVKVEMTINDAVDMQGMFVTSNSTKGGTTGILFSTSVFDDIRSYQAGKVAKTIYQLQGLRG